ncbi:M50 family metallopeptidase [Clostridium paraputrificum]|uniref:M50 family metallopeptidase n=1 Tax=Clostridium paraputrificum TaxID=29363 RepID=UPI003D33A14D
MKKDNKSKGVIGFILLIIVCGVIGGIVGAILGLRKSDIPSLGLFEFILIFVTLFITFIIQVIIHEGGHLVFGLLSGYEFISFRVGSLTIVNDDGKLTIKKFKIQGTGGQCLMMPKNEDYREIKYILFNLGGVFMNTVVSIASVAICITYSDNIILSIFLNMMIISGVIIIITNGIPMKVGGIPNDGYNALSIGKSDIIKYSFYIQLKINGLMYKGKRIKDMPIQWFQLKEGADYNNPLITPVKCIEAAYYHDKLDFDNAKKCYEDLLEVAPDIPKVYEYEIDCELLFYEIIGDRKHEVIERLYTEELKKYIKATETHITKKRLMYAYYLIIERNMDKANKLLKEFEALKKTYPSKGEIANEVEVMEFVRKISLKLI